MGDFGDLVGETLSGTPGLPPGPGEEPLTTKIDALDARCAP